MAAKIVAAPAEEHDFARKVNSALRGSGAKVSPFCMTDPETGARTWHLTCEAGPRRTVIRSDSPFHLDPPDDVIAQVRRWLAALSRDERWTTDPEAADG